MEGKPTQTGLIVVDLQHAFFPPPHIVEGIAAILPRYDIVIATQYLNKKWSLFETKLGYTDCQIGSHESQIVIPLRPRAIFDRFSYGLRPEHIAQLKRYPVLSWDVVGCDTEACVLSTCYNLWDSEIQFNVLKDLCHSSGGQEYHDAAMLIMGRSFGMRDEK